MSALTPARLEELERAYAAMAQGTAFPIRVHDADTPEKMVEAVRISIESSPGTELFGVNINGNPDTIELGPDERCVAYTGNGPTSEANAVGIAALVNAFPALLAAARERETLKQAVVDAERSEKNEHDLRMRWQRMKDELLTEGVALRTRVSALEEAAGPFANLDCVTWCHAIRGEEHDCDVAKLRALLTSTPDVAPKPADDGGRG